MSGDSNVARKMYENEGELKAISERVHGLEVRMEQRLDRVEKDIDDLRGDVRGVDKNVREIRDAVVENKGKWKGLLMVGTISGAVGSAITLIAKFGAAFK